MTCGSGSHVGPIVRLELQHFVIGLLFSKPFLLSVLIALPTSEPSLMMCKVSYHGKFCSALIDSVNDFSTATSKPQTRKDSRGAFYVIWR